MKKWIVLAALVGAGYFGWQQWQIWQAKMAQAQNPGRPTTSPVIQTNISFGVNAAGEIGPAEQVSVRPQVNGIIKSMPVDIGDTVKSGDPLFTLDDQDLQTQRSTKLIEIEATKLQLVKAERDMHRSEQLFQNKLISVELYDDTRTTYELARNTVEQRSKEIALIEYQITLTKIMAPFNCTVLTRPVSVGQAVSGSGGFNAGTEVLTIADLNSMVINAHVNQADVPRLRMDQEVEVAIEAVSGLKLTGQVERIAPQATIKNNIKGFATRILLKNVDPRVRPGMTANVRIPVASAANVMAVPLAAVFTERNEETQQLERYVFVQKGDGFEKRVIQLGVSDYFNAEVQAGLSPGEVVALELPKEEKQRQGKMLAGLRPGGGDAGGLRAGLAPGGRGPLNLSTGSPPVLGSKTAAAKTPTNATAMAATVPVQSGGGSNSGAAAAH